jgi:hypothetical protein
VKRIQLQTRKTNGRLEELGTRQSTLPLEITYLAKNGMMRKVNVRLFIIDDSLAIDAGSEVIKLGAGAML